MSSLSMDDEEKKQSYNHTHSSDGGTTSAATAAGNNSSHNNHGPTVTRRQEEENSHSSSTTTTPNREKCNSHGTSSHTKRRSIPIVTTPKRGGDTDEDDDEIDQEEEEILSYRNSQGIPEDRTHRQSTAQSRADTTGGESAEMGASVPADQERQILLLMLLAQVCALHDPTPRTFTVHVLELFERGILGRHSIHFLFELGLVPSVPSNTPLLLPPSSTASGLELATTSNAVAAPTSPQSLRTLEASAIRSRLEQHDRAEAAATTGNTAPDTPPGVMMHEPSTDASPETVVSTSKAAPPHASSWAVEHHPLSLSRYQREFKQVRLLNSGSFGEVFQASNKMDGRDYAIKRVIFSAWGYSKDSVTQVVREVHCLAQCDHPYVVRYYASWLEPSWMTGSTTSATTSHQLKQQRKLLTDIQHMMSTGKEEASSSQSKQQSSHDIDDVDDTLKLYFKDHAASLRNRKFSLGSSMDSFDEHNEEGSIWDGSSCDSEISDDGSEWSGDDHNHNNQYNSIKGNSWAMDDSFISFQRSEESSSNQWGTKPSTPPRRCKTTGLNNDNKKKAPQLNYRYQICLFIQMQLCHPATLGDWIRTRNAKSPEQDHANRIGPAATIFSQIVQGLHHVHANGIIHRDLKPTNIFASMDDDELVFRIGDFGLSKLIHAATHHKKAKHHHHHRHGKPSAFDTSAGCVVQPPESPPRPHATELTWHDPLTAGVGTLSYASPEQQVTRTYGKAADVFSLGLILLELVCSFTTEHERLQNFHDCRQRRCLPSWLVEHYPVAAKIILDCTQHDPARRPTAEDLLRVNILPKRSTTPETGTLEEQMDHSSTGAGSDKILIEELRNELKQKNETLQRCQEEMSAKDRTIDELRREVDRLRLNQDPKYQPSVNTRSSPTIPSHVTSGIALIHDDEQVASSSSSSEDGI